MPHFSLKENKENAESGGSPLKKRASTLSLNLRRVSASSFISQRSLTPTSPNTLPRMQLPLGSNGNSRLGAKAISRLRDSFWRPQNQRGSRAGVELISLPTPVEDSQEKFSSKLRGQASILSLRDSRDAYANRQRALLDELLEMCTANEVLSTPPHLEGHVRTVAFGTGGLDLQQIVQSMKTHKNAPPGFVQTIAAYVVGDNDNDMCLHHELKVVGTPLSEFELASWSEAYEVFWQVAAHLASAERRLQLEHRDLLPRNVLVERNGFTGRLTVTLAALDNARLRLPNGDVSFSRLDKPYFFNADETTRAIYRCMQQMLLSTSNSRSDPEWDQFQPRTNVLWLHVLCDYLLASVKGQDHPLRKKLVQVEQVLNFRKKRFMRARIDSAGDVLAWGDRALK